MTTLALRGIYLTLAFNRLPPPLFVETFPALYLLRRLIRPTSRQRQQDSLEQSRIQALPRKLWSPPCSIAFDRTGLKSASLVTIAITSILGLKISSVASTASRTSTSLELTTGSNPWFSIASTSFSDAY